MEDSNKKDGFWLYKTPTFGHARSAGNFKQKKTEKSEKRT